jgi:hypothetical protein
VVVGGGGVDGGERGVGVARGGVPEGVRLVSEGVSGLLCGRFIEG